MREEGAENSSSIRDAKEKTISRGNDAIVSLAISISPLGTPCIYGGRTARTHAVHARGVCLQVVPLSYLLPEFLDSESEWDGDAILCLARTHVARVSHPRLSLRPSLPPPPSPPLSPSFVTYLSTSPFAVSIISIRRCCLANRVERRCSSILNHS